MVSPRNDFPRSSKWYQKFSTPEGSATIVDSTIWQSCRSTSRLSKSLCSMASSEVDHDLQLLSATNGIFCLPRCNRIVHVCYRYLHRSVTPLIIEGRDNFPTMMGIDQSTCSTDLFIKLITRDQVTCRISDVKWWKALHNRVWSIVSCWENSSMPSRTTGSWQDTSVGCLVSLFDMARTHLPCFPSRRLSTKMASWSRNA